MIIFLYLLLYWFIIYVCFGTSQTNKAWLWHWLSIKGCLNVSKCLEKKKKERKHSIISFQWRNKHFWCVFVDCLWRCNKCLKTCSFCYPFFRMMYDFYFFPYFVTFLLLTKRRRRRKKTASVLQTITNCKCVTSD